MMFFLEYDTYKPQFETLTGQIVSEDNQALYLSWLSVKISSQVLTKIKTIEDILAKQKE